MNRRGISIVFRKAWLYLINLFIIEFLETFMIYYLVLLHCTEISSEVRLNTEIHG